MFDLVFAKYQYPMIHLSVHAAMAEKTVLVLVKPDNIFGVHPDAIANSRNFLCRCYMFFYQIMGIGDNSKNYTAKGLKEEYPNTYQAMLTQPFGKIDIQLAHGHTEYWG